MLSAAVLPRTILLLVGGVVGDRWGARRVMIVGDTVMLTVAVVVAIGTGHGRTPLPFLIAVALVIGTVGAFYLPSLGSMPRRLVDDGQLDRALAVRQAGSQIVTMIGAPLGGAFVAIAGLTLAAWVDAVSFAVVLLVLVVIRPQFDLVARVDRSSMARQAADGLRVVRRTPGLGPALVLVAGAAGFVVPSMSLLVPLLARERGWGAASAGLLVAAQGLGMIVATVVVTRRGSAARPGVAAALGLATAAVGQLLVTLLHPAAPAVVSATLIGIGTGTFVVNLAPVVLGTAPRTHLARIQSLVSLVQSSALLVTNNALGAISTTVSAPFALGCCAAAVTACAATALGAPAIRSLARAA